MSLLRWLKKPGDESGKTNVVVVEDVDPLLPNPNLEATQEKRAETAAVNKVVSEAVVHEVKSKKRKNYNHYDDELKARIGRHAAERGNKSAVEKFSKELGYDIQESTVRHFKKRYYGELKKCGDPDSVTALPRLNPGRSTLLPTHIEAALSDYITKLRQNGGVVNRTIVLSAGTGMVEHHDKRLLRKYGGTIELKKDWAQSFMTRAGLVKRKATKAARKVPDDFADQKVNFLESIRKARTDDSIPDDLVVNWDQTGVRLVPSSDWTMADCGSKQVEVRGLGDKREITVLLAITMSGVLLPPQVLYTGKTDRCHPRQSFPEEWDIHHSENHWSNEGTMLHYIEHVLVPYVTATRLRLELPDTQPALAIFDVFAAHRVQSVKDRLKEANIKFVYVPAGCTGELQPLDLAFNDPFKRAMKQKFTDWYAAEVKVALDEDRPVDINLNTASIKERHAQWLVQVVTELEKDEALIKRGFAQSGIAEM